MSARRAVWAACGRPSYGICEKSMPTFQNGHFHRNTRPHTYIVSLAISSPLSPSRARPSHFPLTTMYYASTMEGGWVGSARLCTIITSRARVIIPPRPGHAQPRTVHAGPRHTCPIRSCTPHSRPFLPNSRHTAGLRGGEDGRTIDYIGVTCALAPAHARGKRDIVRAALSLRLSLLALEPVPRAVWVAGGEYRVLRPRSTVFHRVPDRAHGARIAPVAPWCAGGPQRVTGSLPGPRVQARADSPINPLPRDVKFWWNL